MFGTVGSSGGSEDKLDELDILKQRKTRQGKAGQGKARQGKARQGKAKPDKRRQEKDKTTHHNTTQGAVEIEKGVEAHRHRPSIVARNRYFP
jgi:hypothetical protein